MGRNQEGAPGDGSLSSLGNAFRQFQKATGPTPSPSFNGFGLASSPVANSTSNPLMSLFKNKVDATTQHNMDLGKLFLNPNQPQKQYNTWPGGENSPANNSVDNPYTRLATQTPPPEVNPYEALQQQLMAQLQGINTPAASDQSLRDQANSQAAMQYDPVIAALQGEMDRTSQKSQQDQGKARDMYNALASGFNSEIPGIQQQSQADQNAVTQQYNNNAAQMQAAYQAQQQQQQDLMNKLGIQAAQGDPRLQQAATDQQYFANQNQTDAQHQRDMLQQIAAADTGYQRNIASSSKLAGENTAQDLNNQLNQYLGSANDKMSGLQTSKAADITNLYNQLKNADAQRVTQSNQDAFNQLMSLNNFQLNTLNAQNQQQNSQNDFALKLQELQQKLQGNSMGQNSGLSGSANLLAQRYGTDVNKATQLENILGQVLSQPDVISGQQKTKDANGQDTMVKMTPEYVMQQLRNLAQKNNLQGGDINNLIDAYLAFNGSLR